MVQARNTEYVSEQNSEQNMTHIDNGKYSLLMRALRVAGLELEEVRMLSKT